MTTIAQQSALDNALVAPENQCVIGKCNIRINLGMKPKEPTYQVVLDALALTTCYPAFLITAEVPDDLAYQIDNKDYNKQDKMFYPRFTKIIIHHFLKKDKSISMRNRTFMHTAQVYGAIFPKAMTNQAMLDSVAYKTYYAIALGAELPKSKKTKMKSDSAISSEETPSKKKPTKAKKDVPLTKKPATKPKLTKKKAPFKADRGKSLNILSEVALSEAAQLKEVTKRSKKYFYISYASGSGDGTDFQSRVPDEQQRKISGTNEGTGTKPGVPDVPKYDSESDKESWGSSGEEDDNDEDDTEDDEGNDDGDGNDDDDDDNDGDDDDDSDQERIELDRDEIPNLNQFNEEHEEEEENFDEFSDKEDDVNNANEENEEELDDGEELYKDVNVNLKKEDVEMTDADQSGADQHNVSQESGFEKEEEDAHVTLTAVHDTQKTEGPMQSSYVSSDFTDKILTFKNVSPADNEIASLMDTTVCHEEPNGQTSTLFIVPIMVIPTTISPPPHFFNPLPQQATPTPTPTTSEATTSFPALLDFSFVFKFNDRVTKFETDLSEMKQVDQYAQAISSIPAIVDHYINNNLGEAIHKAIQSHNAECREEAEAEKQEKILLDKMEESKSHLRTDYKRELYDALVNSYNTDKDLFNTYEEPSHTVDDSRVQKNQEFDTGNNDEQLDDEAASNNDWFKKLERPPTPDPDWNKRQHVDFRPPQTWISVTAREEKPPTSFDELMDTPIDFSAFVMNRLNIPNLTQELLTKATTYEIKWIEDMVPNLWSPVKVWYDYDHLDEIEVRREDQQLYMFKDGDFPRLRLQDIEDMFLLLVQQRLTNLTVDKRYDLNVALRMFTRRIVESQEQNRLHCIFRPSRSDIQGLEQQKQIDAYYELHKFSDGTLNDVRTALHDIASGIRMEYLPKRKWSR
ncbi:hypothetical protein Tco_1132306 [Tanacetum coccineum]|uniref:Uncharacterized protein n=1 Tax=Tanacetum coccineum TaxID=301880 RepID=A0ABQ5JCY6_9ASTR